MGRVWASASGFLALAERDDGGSRGGEGGRGASDQRWDGEDDDGGRALRAWRAMAVARRWK